MNIGFEPLINLNQEEMKVLLLLGLLYRSSLAISNSILSVAMTQTNSVVSQQTQLSYSITLSTALPLDTAGDCIQFSVANPYSTTSTDSNLIAIQNYYKAFPTSGIACQSLTTGVTTSCSSGITDFVLPVNVGISTSGQTITKVQGTISPFNNPFSVVSTIITIGYLNGCTGSPANTKTWTLSQFTPGSFAQTPTPAVQLVSSSTVIGDTGATLTVSFKPSTILQVKGIIQLTVPPYFTLSTGSQGAMINYDSSVPTFVTSTSMTVIDSTITFNPTSRVLSFSYTLTASATSSTPLSFDVKKFNNPINQNALGGFLLTTLDPNQNMIDTSTTSFSLPAVTTAATIQTATLQLLRADNQQSSSEIARTGRTITVSFSIDFPIQQNCYIKISFPQEVPIDADEVLQTYTGSGFIASSVLSTQVKKVAYQYGADLTLGTSNYVLIPGCTDPVFLQSGSGSAQVTMGNVISPSQVKTTGDFYIDFYSDPSMSSSSLIATTRTSSSLNLKILDSSLQQGSITNKIFAPVLDKTISSTTDFLVSFTITHSLYKDSIIVITAPSQTSAIPGSTTCDIRQISSQFESSTASCVLQSTSPVVFWIMNPFSQSIDEEWALSLEGASSSYADLSIQINGIKNPSATQSAGAWSVVTKNLVGTSYYTVDDSGSDSVGTYTPESGVLTPAGTGGLEVSDKTTYLSSASYIFSITLQHDLPSGGKILIELPSDFAIISTNLDCQYEIPTTLSYTQQTCSQPSSLSIEISFSQTTHSSSQTLKLKITGIRNPRTTKASDGITISTTQSGYLIDTGSGFSTTMDKMNDFTLLTALMSNNTNGAVTDYTLSLTASIVPVVNGDILYVTFPSEVKLPSNVQCVVSTGISSISCSNSGQNLIATIRTLSSSNTNVPQTLKFIVKAVTNPPSTMASSIFTNVYFTDSTGLFVQQLKAGVKVTVQTTTPARIFNPSLSLDNGELGANDSYKIEFVPQNQIGSAGSIVLTLPAQVQITTGVSCQVTTNSKFSNLCTIDTKKSTITIQGAFAQVSNGYKGNVIIELYPVKNPVDNRVLNGFSIATYNDAAFSQKIDVYNGTQLVPNLTCNFPCETCRGSSYPDYCLSCWTQFSLNYLQYDEQTDTQTCQEACSSGSTSNGNTNFICVPCDPTCQTCQDNGLVGDKFACTKCDDQTPIFYPQTKRCLSKCEDGNFLSSKTVCSPCSSSCKTCSTNAQTCTSCKGNSLTPYLYQTSCLASCPPKFVGVESQCVSCTSPCNTCINETSQCLSCDQTTPFKYFFAYQCYKQCPNGTVADQSTMTCKGCLSGCKECDQKNQTKCYQCTSPLILWNSQCLSDCPAGLKINANGDSCVPIQNQDLTLIYFPHLVCCLLMTVLCIGGYFKDKKSIIISNMIIFWAPLEILSILIQLGLSIFQSSLIVQAATGFVLLFYVVLNITYYVRFKRVVGEADEEYKFWKTLHPMTSKFISGVSGFFSFKMIRLNFSYLYGFDNFKARFSSPNDYVSQLRTFTILHMIFCNGIIIAVDVYQQLNFSMSTQIGITQIETAAIALVMIILQLFELRRIRRYVLLEYDEIEPESFSVSEEKADRQNRREMLKKIMQQCKGNQDLINDANGKPDFTPKDARRRCNSMENLEKLLEQDPREIRSEPPNQKPDWDNDDNSEVPDNVYAESKPFDPLALIGKQFVDVNTQVFPEEFGKIMRKGVDYMGVDSPEPLGYKRKDKNKKRGRKNQYYTQIDAEDDEEADHLNESQLEIRQENQLGIIKEVDEAKKKSPKGTRSSREMEREMKKIEKESGKKEPEKKERMFNPTSEDPIVQVPPNPFQRNFNENDILGQFDLDEKGHFILVKDNEGNFIDKKGRRVNERGYLVDPQTGHIIERHEKQKMFEQDEVDERGEIPAPFCVERYNFNPFKLRGDFALDRNTKQPLILKDKKGALVDKLGRNVNKRGWLVDKQGNVIDFLGVKKFDKKHLEDGNLQKLFNYSGQRYDILDVCGVFDLDPKSGLIKLKTNNQGQCFDNLGRLVNQKGYLIDYNGHVVDIKGKKIFDKKFLSSNGEIPKIFPFSKFNIKNIQGDFEMDPLGNPILEKNLHGWLIDRAGKRVNAKGYFCDDDGNILDKKGKVMFSKEILDVDGEIPEVFRAGLLRVDTGSSLSRLMSEIEKNQPEEMYGQPKPKKVIVGSGGGNTSVESMMDDTPSNYDAANMRFHTNRKKMVKIAEETSSAGGDFIKKKGKRMKKIVQEFNEPSDRDRQLAQAYGGVAKGSLKRKEKRSPGSSVSRQSRKLKGVSGSVAGFQRNNQSSIRNMEETKVDQRQNQSMAMLNDTNDPSVMAVPEHHIREQRLKKQKIKELKMQAKLKKKQAGHFDPDFEKMFGKDIDEFLEDSDWDIESFDNMSNYSRGTARSAFLDSRLRGLESIYLQRIESQLKRGGGAVKSKKSASNYRRPKFRPTQDRFMDEPNALEDVSSIHSQNRVTSLPQKAQQQYSSQLNSQMPHRAAATSQHTMHRQ